MSKAAKHLVKLMNAARIAGDVDLYVDLQGQLARELTSK